jgi:hypothetical protein
MKIIIIIKIILHNISFVEIIVGPKKPNLVPKINCTIFWNNYNICTIILDQKVPQRGSL